ncbi:MAG: uroporphyrinogen-III decarboxylase-like protein [Planctomycetota bacterium]|nr:MAG: uroporphyrinogen-III decarboxylase-like protein [Planctomycetota bacterium]
MKTMNSRERWLAILNGRQPDRIPTDLWCTDEVSDRLKADLSCPDNESLCRRLHIDRPHHIEEPSGPLVRCRLSHHPNDPQANIWGVRLKDVNYGTGIYSETVYHPLANVTSVAEVEAFRWPRVEDFDYSSIESEFAKIDGSRIVQAGRFEPFLLACQMRGMEQAYMDLLVEPAIIQAILEHIFEFHYQHNRRVFEVGAGRIDLFYLAEDLGSQTGPLIKLETYRQFLKPNQIRMADLVRKFGIKILYHTDGAARIFLNDLIDDVGIDVLNPIQWRCPGMERDSLVKEFGRRVAFHGAVDNQYTLPFGSVQEVVEEVKQNIELFAEARWICAPCHRIQPNTPTANIVAMYETIHELGRL